MQLFYARFTLFFFIHTSFVFSFSPPRIRQTNSEQLPNSLCGFNLDSANEHTLDAQCTLGSGLINSVVPLEKCITNTCGDLSVSTSIAAAFYILRMLISNSFSLSKLFISPYRNWTLTYYSGAFSTTCNKCTLDGISLEFTCTCTDCTGQDSVSMLNLSKYINYIRFLL